MKHLKLTFAVCLFALTGEKAFSQDSLSVKGKHEFGINLFTAQSLSFEYHDRAALPGIYYRLHSKANALRVSFEVRQKFFNLHTTPPPPDMSYAADVHTVRTFFDARIGYQRSFGRWKHIVPYAFADLVGRYRYTEGSWDDRVTGEYKPLHSRVIDGGVAIGAGVRWNVWNKLWLCYETDIQLTCGNLYDYVGQQTYAPWWEAYFRQVRTFGLSWRF